MKVVHVLVIEDSWLEAELLRDLISIHFRKLNYQPHIDCVKTEKEAYRHLSEKKYGLAIFDIDLDRRNAGLDLLKQFANTVSLPVISSSREADEIINLGYEFGCEHYLTKPVYETKIKSLVEDFVRRSQSSDIINLIKGKFLTQDPETLSQLQKIRDCGLASTHIQGPTGVGKQVIAELIHDVIVGEQKPFIERNCSAVEDSLADSLLFGHTKGSFTGAVDNKDGIFVMGNGGTIFLDEIDKTSKAFQAKLLKVIEQKIVTPIGSNKKISVDFKLVTASSQNIGEMVESGRFLPDLWERLQGELIDIKGLSERTVDIDYQLKHFMKSHPSGRVFLVSPEAKRLLHDYHWPGNTRELKELVNRIQRRNIKVLKMEHLDSIKKRMLQCRNNLITPAILRSAKELGLAETLHQIGKELCESILFQSSGSHRETMRTLGIGTRAFYKFIGHKASQGEAHGVIQY